MVKLVAMYKGVEDPAAFDEKYFGEHLPLAGKMPGLIKTEVTRLKGIGDSESKFYLLTEMYFEDIDALNSAMGSQEGRTAAKNLMSFAKDNVVMLIGDIEETKK